MEAGGSEEEKNLETRRLGVSGGFFPGFVDFTTTGPIHLFCKLPEGFRVSTPKGFVSTYIVGNTHPSQNI